MAPTFTGWDVDGGYAEACVVREEFAYALPDGVDDEHAAPLRCAGIVGYRALRAAAVPPLAGKLGVDSAGSTTDELPEPLDGAVTFAPAGELVPRAVEALDRGGTLAVAGIHLTDVPALSYQDTLFDREFVEPKEALGMAVLPVRRPGGRSRPPGRREDRAAAAVRHGALDLRPTKGQRRPSRRSPVAPGSYRRP